MVEQHKIQNSTEYARLWYAIDGMLLSEMAYLIYFAGWVLKKNWEIR